MQSVKDIWKAIIINILAGGLIMIDAIFNRKENLHTYIILGGKEKKLERVISYKINKADNILYMAILQFVIISLTLNYKYL